MQLPRRTQSSLDGLESGAAAVAFQIPAVADSYLVFSLVFIFSFELQE